MKKVVVTGIGSINALGHNVKDSFANIIKGEIGIDNISHFDASALGFQIAAEVKGFEPSKLIDGKEIKKIDRFIQLAIFAAEEAMNDSAFDLDSDKVDFGVSSASGIGGLINIQNTSIAYSQKGARRISPFFIPSSLINMIGGVISIRYGLQGPNLSSVTACAASTHAICEAYKTIMMGPAERMLVVGSEATICATGIGGFHAMRALSSSHNDDPKKASRPFDKARDGFVMGEGAAALVLEEYEAAKQRNAKIYAEVVGIGESGDASHITAPAPNAEGAFRAMQNALKMARNNIGHDFEVDYINAHGTSTPLNDMYETIAIKRIFDNQKMPLVSSTKGAIGHCLGASGSIESVIAIQAMNEGVLPPTVNYETPDLDNGLDLDYIPNQARSQDCQVVMSNSFGFGGTNGVVVFRKV